MYIHIRTTPLRLAMHYVETIGENPTWTVAAVETATFRCHNPSR